MGDKLTRSISARGTTSLSNSPLRVDPGCLRIDTPMLRLATEDELKTVWVRIPIALGTWSKVLHMQEAEIDQ
jgi:hypothetical protein